MIKNISDLISIKNYLINMINGNFNMDKSAAKNIYNIMLFIDDKILRLVQSEDFLKEIDYSEEQLKLVLAKAIANNTMKRPEGK